MVMSVSRSIRWGILGTSFISEVMADAIKKSTHGQLVAIGSTTKAEAFSQKITGMSRGVRLQLNVLIAIKHC
jgi:hypothetical protein